MSIHLNTLSRMNKLLKQIADNIIDLICIINRTGNFEYVSPSFKKNLGFDPDYLENRNIYDFIHPEDSEAVRNSFASVIEDGKVRTAEYRFRNSKLEYTWLESSCSMLVDENWEEIGLVVVSHDVTQRKAFEMILMDNEHKFRTIFENSPQGICILSDMKVINANSAFLNIFGYGNMDEIKNLGMNDFINDIDKMRIIDVSKNTGFPEKVRNELELQGRRRNGEIFPLTCNFSHMELPEGKAIVGFFRDLTEERKSEIKIQTALKEKEILLKEIHHRVKNNMQIISSLLNLQSESIEDPISLELFNESKNRIKTMALIHERLYQSKDFAGINFADYINELIKYLSRSYKIEYSKLDTLLNLENITLSIDQAIPCGLMINELVSNAFKYGLDRDTDNVLSVSFAKEKGIYRLEIEDNGRGFPEDIDFRNTKTLGLQLVNNLVEQLSGTIELEKAKGTKFVIIFPENG